MSRYLRRAIYESGLILQLGARNEASESFEKREREGKDEGESRRGRQRVCARLLRKRWW